MVNLEQGRNSNSQKDNYMITVTKDDLLKSGAHFGHVTSKTNPNFRDYVLSQKNGIDIINLDDTINNLNKALLFVKNIVEKNLNLNNIIGCILILGGILLSQLAPIYEKNYK